MKKCALQTYTIITKLPDILNFRENLLEIGK